MPVTFDAIGTPAQDSGTGGSVAITIGAGANRAVVLCCSMTTNTAGIAASIGGTPLAIISGTDGEGSTGTVLLGCPAPPSGAQTITVSWTGAQAYSLGALSFTGVDQSTPFTNGTVGSGGSVAVTSAAGDLTTTNLYSADGVTATSNQTKKTGLSKMSADIGPGTGTTTHTWTGSGMYGPSGANMTAAAAEISGAAAVTLGALTSAAAGAVAVTGSATPTLGALTSTAAGAVALAGASATTLDTLTVGATGTAALGGSSAITLVDLTATAAGTVAVTAAAAPTLDALTSVATGTVAALLIQGLFGGGALLDENGDPILDENGDPILDEGSPLGALTMVAAGVVAGGPGPSVGSLANTLGALTLVATGTMPVVGFTPILTADEIMQIAYRRTDRDPGWMAPRPPRPVEDHVAKLAGPDPGPWPYPPDDFWEAR